VREKITSKRRYSRNKIHIDRILGFFSIMNIIHSFITF
jgi:hypothetical protein